MSWRNLTNLCLSVSLALPYNTVRAESAPAMSPAQAFETVQKINFAGLPRAFQNMRDMKLDVNKAGEALSKLAASRPAEMSAHVGQTLLFLLTVTGVELVRSELAERRAGRASEETLAEMAKIAATHLLNSGGTYLSILGAGVADLGLHYPAKALAAWLADPKARPILFQSLTTSILATGSLVGWEAGSQLWIEASFLLETPAEFERSKSLFGMTGGALRALLFSHQIADAQDLKLVKTMSRNLVYVALLDQKLRSAWIDNTFRTRIMTGDFVILTAALTAAGVGTMFLPGGGTVAGFILGVGAVVVAMSIPEQLKDCITGGLHGVRMGAQRNRLYTVDIELRDQVRGSFSWIATDRKLTRVRELYKWRQQIRSSYLTISLERARLLFKGLFRTKSQPLSSAEGRTQLRLVFSDFQKFFDHEIKTSDSLARGAAQGSSPQVLAVIVSEQARTVALAGFFNQLALELDTIFDSHTSNPITFNSLSPRAQEFVKFIEVSYSRGFDEQNVVN